MFDFENKITLRKFTNDDLTIIKNWLNKERIKKWYGEPEEWIEEIKNVNGDFDWITKYIALYEDIPFGFCQSFDCSKSPKGFEWDNEADGTFGIDYMIGEEIFLGKGLGSVLIQKLHQCIIADNHPKYFIADPVKENERSIKLLEKNGYAFDQVTGLYKFVL